MKRSRHTAMKLGRSPLGDAVLAIALAVIGVVGTTAATSDVSGPLPQRPLDVLGYAAIATAGGMLVVRRRWPVPTLAVVTVLSAVYLAVGYPYGPILFSLFVAVYTIARERPLRCSAPASAASGALLLVHLFTNSASLPGYWGVLPASAWVVVPFAIGVTVRVTAESAERERAEIIRQRVDHERLRVAQEVHDIVGHGLAAIRMQAEVALHVQAKKPDQARVALDAISRTSGEALDELRATLGLLRNADDDDRRAPALRLPRLEELRQRMSDAGARISIETAGTPRPLPATVEAAVYRVVQESLTNVLRHSDTKDATVCIDYGDDDIAVSVANPLGAARIAGQGLGIAGMRKRVTALGGDFAAGATADERFEVRARIPAKDVP